MEPILVSDVDLLNIAAMVEISQYEDSTPAAYASSLSFLQSQYPVTVPDPAGQISHYVPTSSNVSPEKLSRNLSMLGGKSGGRRAPGGQEPDAPGVITNRYLSLLDKKPLENWEKVHLKLYEKEFFAEHPGKIANYLYSDTKSMQRELIIIWVALDDMRFKDYYLPTKEVSLKLGNTAIPNDPARKDNQVWQRNEVEHLQQAINRCNRRPPYWIAETVLKLQGLRRHTLAAIWWRCEELMASTNVQPSREAPMKTFNVFNMPNSSFTFAPHFHLL
ncbi:hypothetical protein Ddc_18994 [Ditylenchus destructor]|nr:hypothetical protein Ddc_18994 [Ditylenchus destructor]